VSYVPSFVTETDVAPPYRLCSMASGAMLADAITGGLIHRSAQQMAILAGTGIYPRYGTTLAQVGYAFSRLGLTLDRRVCEWADVPQRHWLVVQGKMRPVPLSLRIQKNYAGGHAVLAWIDGGRSWVMDPLGHGDYGGAWWPTVTLREYALALVPGRVAYIAVGPVCIMHQETETGDQMISAGGLMISSDYILPLPAGMRVYRSPGSTEFYTLTERIEPQFIGNADGGWRAVLIKTATFYSDHGARATVLYVKTDAKAVSKEG
jgi:hypothetical protein